MLRNTFLIKSRLLRRILLIIILLTSFYSCKKEDLSSDSDKSETNLFEKKIGFIDYKTLLANIGESTAFKSNSQFFEKIDYANKGARFMDAYIDTETIHMIEGATVNFYTLKIINNNPEERTTTFYNLVFQEDLESGEVTSCIL